ncbi:MAG TPA: hypothetical protein VN914_19075 [Polyangia bacterium]|jgi:hypothetical protein|nr:hypothetical protein [Polyangia bacterium]
MADERSRFTLKTPRQRLIFGVLSVLLVAGLIVAGRLRARHAEKPAELAPGVATVYPVDAWLDSCLNGCRRTALRQLAQLSPERRERYCTVNCECGMEKMTEPGPGPRQVRAPSRSWMSLDENKQAEAAAECRKRSNGAIGQ